VAAVSCSLPVGPPAVRRLRQAVAMLRLGGTRGPLAQ